MNRSSFFWIGTLLIILGCTEAEEISQDVPRVVTNGSVLTSIEGAIFEARVITTGGSPVIGHGFQWHEASNFAIDFVNLGALNSDRFITEINSGFDIQKRYEVRAFIETETYTAYGEWIEFSGAGSIAPEIAAITPLSGTWGDTVTITGKYFSFNRDIVKVEFDDVEAEIVSLEDTELKVKVPLHAIKSSATPIVITIGTKFTRSKDLFSIISPVLSGIEPNKGGSGTMVTIIGKNFNPQYTTLKIGALDVSIDFISTDSLKFKLPKEVTAGFQDLMIKSGPFALNLENGFFRNHPIVTEISPVVAFFGDTILLRGENFGSPFTDNTIFASGEFATIISSAPGELKIVLPYVARHEIEFLLTADYVTSYSDIKLKINDPVITDVLPHDQVYPGQDVIVKGDYFFPTSFYGNLYNHELKVDNKSALVKSATRNQIVGELPIVANNEATASLIYFDTIQAVSTQSVISPITSSGKFPGSTRVKSASFTIGSKSYVLTGIELSTLANNEVYVFDASTKLWTNSANFPGQRRYGATAFSIGNKGYIMGGYDEFNFDLRDVWEYDSSTDSWTRKSDILFHPLEAFNLNGEVFSLSDITYIVIPPSTEISGRGYNTEFWKYDPSTDGWMKKAIPPATLRRSSFSYPDYFTMQVGGTLTTGYLSADESYIYHQYNTITDEWISKGLANIKGGSPITFEYGGAGYLLTNQFLYQYDVGQNKWSLLEIGLNPMVWQGGEATKFKVNESWYFMLFQYNDRYLNSPDLAVYRNMIIEFNCELAGF